MVVGLFVILIGILIFVYWILLPVPEKEKLLEEIYGYRNVSNQSTTNLSYEANVVSKLILRDIYLYSDKKEINVARDYYLGTLVPVSEIGFGDVYEETTIFLGKKYKIIRFFYSNEDAIALSFISKCTGGYFTIRVNDFEVYSGCPSGIQKVLIQKDYLRREDNIIRIDFYPTSIFSKATFSLNNTKLIYMNRSKIEYNFYYQGERVYISYNFCPADSNSINFYINDYKLPIYLCQNDYLEITNYLKSGLNYIKVTSEIETKVDLKFITSNSIFYYPFNFTIKDIAFLYVIKEQGDADIYVNGCKYSLNTYQTSFMFPVNKSCLSLENVLVIKPKGFVRINMLSLI